MAQIQDTRLRRLYSENLANLVGVDIKLVEQSVSRAVAGMSHPGSAIRPVSQETTKPVPTAPKFDLSKVPRVEGELLNVILMREVYLKEAIESGVVEQFTHLGCKAVFLRIAEVYGQLPNKFDTLSALLADEVRPVEAITRHLAELYTSLSDEAARKLLQDCIKRVKDNFERILSREKIATLRGSGDSNPTDQLEQIMNIQKNRRSLNRDS